MASTLAYVLHTRPWRETSLLVDALTQEFGRVCLIAKGAKRPHSALRGFLEPFIPVAVQFSGKSSLKNLTHAQWIQAAVPLPAAHAMSGWYLSELCLRGTVEDDPNPALFAAYDAAIRSLAGAGALDDTQNVLRQFEHQFLQAQGLWPAAPDDLNPSFYYTLNDSQGWHVATLSNAPWCLSGAHIAQLALGRLDTRPMAAEDKLSLRLAMRAMMARALPDQALNTRAVWLELEQLK